MISSYNEETRVYTCFFTREEYNNLLILTSAGVCSYHGIESYVNIDEYRALRDEIFNSYVKP